MFKLVIVLVAIAACAQALPSKLGGFTEQTGVTDKVMELARWTTSQLSGYTGIQGDHSVMSVRNVQTQVVNGINYKFTIDVIIGTEDNKYVIRTCDVLVNEQEWANTKTLVSAQCAANPQYPKRQEMTGAWTEQTAVTDNVMDIARWTTSQLAGFTGIQGDHSVMSVRNIQTQVVNGINYKFTVDVLVGTEDNKYFFRTCDVMVNEQTWTNTRTLLSAQCAANPQYPKRDLIGGFTEQTAVTDNVMDIARWTTSQLSSYTGIEGDHSVMSVRNVQTQVVNGINYKFTVDVLVGTAENKYFFKTCDVMVNEQSWTNTRSLVSAKCGNNPQYPNF